MQGSTGPVLLSGWTGEVTQASSGIAPVGTYTLGPAECCIGLQALTEHVSNIGIAVVTDTASEEGIWRDEPVALCEDLAQHQLTERCRGAWGGGQCAGHWGLGSGARERARLS